MQGTEMVKKNGKVEKKYWSIIILRNLSKMFRDCCMIKYVLIIFKSLAYFLQKKHSTQHYLRAM